MSEGKRFPYPKVLWWVVRPHLSQRWSPADAGGACGTLVEAPRWSMAAPENIQRLTDEAASERDEIERRLARSPTPERGISRKAACRRRPPLTLIVFGYLDFDPGDVGGDADGGSFDRAGCPEGRKGCPIVHRVSTVGRFGESLRQGGEP